MSRPATSRLKVNPPLGKPPVLEWVAPADLNVDETYQRSLESDTSQTLIRKIAAFWDWGLCQPVNVARRADGSLWIVDGQHRHAAAVLRDDVQHLPCVIQSFPTRGDEAAAFVALNKQRRALNAVDIFKASLAAGDEDAATVMQLISDAGLSIARHQNYAAWKPAQLYCIPTIQSGYRRHGKVVVSAALCALAEVFEGEVLHAAGNLLEGLIIFYAHELREDAFEPDIFIEALNSHSQSEWVRRARAEMARADLNRKEAMRSVLTAEYLDRLEQFLEVAA